MRIIQILSTIAYGDAIGNEVFALKKVLEDMGYETGVYALSIVPPLNHEDASDIGELPDLGEKDVIIYHLSTGTQLNYDLAGFKGKKIIIYHNITPPEFFSGYDSFFEKISEEGLEGARFLADKADYCLADSEFNKEDLRKLGYSMPIDILPVVIPFDEYRRTPGQGILNKYRDGRHNILFTGRVAPNKCHQDIIAAFACYKKYYDANARLFLVGSYKETDKYYRKLKKYVELLKVEDVVFTGHIKFEEILSYYCLADVFLCMSEHEGFCVPLIEAMLFGVPVIAYKSAAVPLTLGDGGILIHEKKPMETAALIDRVIKDSGLRETIRENQTSRLEDFKYETTVGLFRKYMEKFIEIEGLIK